MLCKQKFVGFDLLFLCTFQSLMRYNGTTNESTGSQSSESIRFCWVYMQRQRISRRRSVRSVRQWKGGIGLTNFSFAWRSRSEKKGMNRNSPI